MSLYRCSETRSTSVSVWLEDVAKSADIHLKLSSFSDAYLLLSSSVRSYRRRNIQLSIGPIIILRPVDREVWNERGICTPNARGLLCTAPLSHRIRNIKKVEYFYCQVQLECGWSNCVVTVFAASPLTIGLIRVYCLLWCDFPSSYTSGFSFGPS